MLLQVNKNRNAGAICSRKKLVLTYNGWPSPINMIFSGQLLGRKVLPGNYALAFFDHPGGVVGVVILQITFEA